MQHSIGHVIASPENITPSPLTLLKWTGIDEVLGDALKTFLLLNPIPNFPNDFRPQTHPF